MSIVLLIALAITSIATIIFVYLYVQLTKKYADTNFTPFFMGRITPFTKENEESLSGNKAALELTIQLMEHKLHAKVSELVEFHESDKKANVCR